MTEKELPDLSSSADGRKLLPSCQKNADGGARFMMVLPEAYHEDPGLSLLARCEALHSGYEYPYRMFLDTHLEPGDVFIDVGAHFGIYSLSAVTAPSGGVRVIAVEPDPHNVQVFKLWTALNKQSRSIEIIEAACGAEPGAAKLWANSSMGHQVGGERPADALQTSQPIDVALVTIDQILAARPELKPKRLFIKIDVEGLEPEVIAGAENTLRSGRVAAVIFEKSETYAGVERAQALEAACATLVENGFSFRWFPHVHLPSVFMSWVSGIEMGNIVAVSSDLEPLGVYDGPACPYPPPPPSLTDISNLPYDARARAAFTERLILENATDGWRWCRPPNLEPGAEDRANAVADFLPHSGSLLDIGAGTMRLFQKMPMAVRYTPLDLFRYAKATILADLNQNQFPEGHWSFASILETLEFIHDAPSLLRRVKASADHLILTYRVAEGADMAARRASGYVNDYSAEEFLSLISKTGWTLDECRHTGPYTVILAH
ncbi:MAG: FkbM family methyltransferase [Proteobacteria bacterium]|nr:FkbM family methyltransferase [Pseudomonadota bacterium]